MKHLYPILFWFFPFVCLAQDVALLSCGGQHCIAVNQEGELIAWGDNMYGQCDVPDVSGVVVDLAAGVVNSAAITDSGDLYIWGAYPTAELLPELDGNAIAVESSSYGFVVLLDNGDAVYFQQGLCSPASEVWSSVYTGTNAVASIAMGFHEAIVATTEELVRLVVCNDELNTTGTVLSKVNGGAYHLIGLRQDGQLHVEGTGDSYNGEDEIPEELIGSVFADVSTHHRHNLVITENGGVVAWGRNEFGQSDVPDLANVVDVECTSDGSLAVTSSGEVIFWGAGPASEIPEGLIVKLTEGDFGTVVWGCTDAGACNFQSDATVDDGSCEYSCLYCGEGTVWSDSLQSCQPILTPQNACGTGTIWDTQTESCIPSNPSDSNQDGCIDVNDILDHLVAFGSGC